MIDKTGKCLTIGSILIPGRPKCCIIDPMTRKFRLCLDPNFLSKIGYDAVQSAGLDDLLPDGGAPGKPAGPPRLSPLLVRRQPRQSLLHSLDLVPLTHG